MFNKKQYLKRLDVLNLFEDFIFVIFIYVCGVHMAVWHLWRAEDLKALGTESDPQPLRAISPAFIL